MILLERKIVSHKEGYKLTSLQKQQRTDWSGRAFRAFAATALAACLLAAGCTPKQNDNLPFYEFQNTEGVLVVDDVRYLEDKDTMDTMRVEGQWVFTGEVGDAIGVCSGAEENGGEFTIYEVMDDEKRDLIYARPSGFTFGPYREFIGLREGIRLDAPTPETVSQIVVTCYNQNSKLVELGETAYVELVKALLELYNSQSPGGQSPDGTYEERALNLYQKEYPLYFYLRCSYHVESGAAYLKCADGIFRRLPEGLEELVAVPAP